ncbi:MAG TPA: UTP--glucose-1-phosphate uridylyltransferase GalU [Deltaproteobacteria bacterium]|nr:UTP--glucose-1-phosphate uridylyltransferase GalU [Deltaproteobacteria bacterium]
MKVRKAVFPAAGLGTRFLPASKAVPKEMFPLVDKPLIQYGVEEALASGIRDIIVITAMGKGAIEDHFDRSVQLEQALDAKGKSHALKELRDISDASNFVYTRQKEQLGLGHAVLCAREIVGREPFAVFLGDDIIDAEVPAMKQMLGVFEEYGGAAVVAVQQVPRSQAHMYGIVAGEKVGERTWKVTEMVEKPRGTPPSTLAVIGRYILAPRIFDILDATGRGAGGEIQLTDAIGTLAAEEDVYAYEFEGDRYDAGDKLGFLKANIALAMKRPDFGRELRRFIEGLVG